jgi:hypothetical protein
MSDNLIFVTYLFLLHLHQLPHFVYYLLTISNFCGGDWSMYLTNCDAGIRPNGCCPDAISETERDGLALPDMKLTGNQSSDKPSGNEKADGCT